MRDGRGELLKLLDGGIGKSGLLVEEVKVEEERGSNRVGDGSCRW